MKNTDEKKREKWLRSKVDKKETLRKLRYIKQFWKLKVLRDFYGLSNNVLIRLNGKETVNCTKQTAKIIEWAYEDLKTIQERAKDSVSALKPVSYAKHRGSFGERPRNRQFAHNEQV